METKKNHLGTMQGRLLPKYKGRYQAHPVGYWQDEFGIAKEFGLDLIEFILDYNDAEKNPLLQKSGIIEIAKIIEKTGVSVKTICADYFMEAPLHSPSLDMAQQSREVLQRLIENASALGVNAIVIPCVDQSSLKNEEDFNRFINNTAFIKELAEKKGVFLSLETDLGPNCFKDFLERLHSPVFTVNYDIGNSASLGYDPAEELKAYGGLISDIHIKDRIKGGGSVELGAGSADFNRFFKALAEINYQGPFIMQAYRDDEGVTIFKKQLEWIKPWLAGLVQP